MSEIRVILDHLFRRQTGQMVATLTRLLGPGRLDLAESLVQDALIVAMQTWPMQGIPENPAAWLMRVAKNKAFDLLRHEMVHAGKEAEMTRFTESAAAAAAADAEREPFGAALKLDADLRDDQLRLLFICCHPALALAIIESCLGVGGTRCQWHTSHE